MKYAQLGLLMLLTGCDKLDMHCPTFMPELPGDYYRLCIDQNADPVFCARCLNQCFVNHGALLSKR